MGIVQPNIPVRRMTSERKTQLADPSVRILSRFLTPAIKVFGYTGCPVTGVGLLSWLYLRICENGTERIVLCFCFKSPGLGKWHLGVTIYPL